MHLNAAVFIGDALVQYNIKEECFIFRLKPKSNPANIIMDNIFNLLLEQSDATNYSQTPVRRIRDTVGSLPKFTNTTNRVHQAWRRGKYQLDRYYDAAHL